jgi:hypothetical protein
MAAEALAHARWIEDLPSQARRALAVGRTLCACDGHYHALWGCLRAADVANSLKKEEPRLASLIAPFVRDGAKIMIGGSADTGVLCAIGRIYAPQMPSFAVIDRCSTPLQLIAEFSAANGIACRTLKFNLLDLDGKEQWDLIVLHYTPDFLEPRVHERLFRSVALSLAPGGALILAAMTGAQVSGDHLQTLASVYYDYGLAALQNSALSDLTESREFQDMLRAYAVRWGQRRMNLPSSEDLRSSLHSAGLHILSEYSTPRRHRNLGGAALVDSTSIIVADHPI